jgi:diguanylate cyclase (GGDEF)-like protein/putative nucleotidyltransferase with HDIG domain
MLKRLGALLCGVLILAGAALIPSGNRAGTYLSYSLIALTAFGLDLADGSTMGFLFVILALPQLSWTEALFIAGAALFILAVVRRPKPTPQELLRSLAISGVAVILSQAAFHAPPVRHLDLALRMMIGAAACFIPYNVHGWKKWDWWPFPYYPVAAAVGTMFPASIVLAPLIVLTWRSSRPYGRRLEQQCEQSRSAAALHLRTMETLALAIEARDQPLSGRSKRVQIYCVEIAKEVGLPREEVEALRTASLLYDIGELAIPEHITLKSGQLTQEEFEKVKTHAAVGAAILERARFPYPVVPIVRAHHERWNGTGYPYGLVAEEIPMGARILSAVDAIDSLASPRQHRPAFPLEEAVRQVVAEAGTAFDPRVVSLISKRYRQWEKRVAEESGRQFVDSIYSAQREAKVLFELNRTLGTSLEPCEMFASAREAVGQLVSFETMVLWVERDGVLSPAHLAGDHLALFSSLRIPMGGGVSGRAAEQDETVANGDPSLEMGHLGSALHLCPFQDILSAPVHAGDVRAALSLYRATGTRFTNEDGRVLLSIAGKFAMPLANGFRFQQLTDEALTDPLTGLPNAKALAAKLNDMSTLAAVVVCDLDGFKQVNDRYGHLTGNRLLEALADGFRRSCREQDFVARMGGDEFVLLLPQLKAEDIAARLAQFRAMVRTTGHAVCGSPVVDASFGSASYPRDGVTPDELLACADRRMYRRKAGQKAGVVEMQPRSIGA